VTSVREVRANCSAWAFAPGLRGGDLHGLDAGARQDRVERCGELPGPVTNREPETGGAIAKVHQEIADLLRGPWSVRVRGDPEDVDEAAADFDHEQAAQPQHLCCAKTLHAA
jgi:hypothetical protein